MNQIAVKSTEEQRKETGMQVLLRQSLILLLWQVSELHWAFLFWWEIKMVELWLLKFILVLKSSVVELVTPWISVYKTGKFQPEVIEAEKEIKAVL